MKKSIHLKLEELEVRSFSTTLKDADKNTVKGGNDYTPTTITAPIGTLLSAKTATGTAVPISASVKASLVTSAASLIGSATVISGYGIGTLIWGCNEEPASGGGTYCATFPCCGQPPIAPGGAGLTIEKK